MVYAEVVRNRLVEHACEGVQDLPDEAVRDLLDLQRELWPLADEAQEQMRHYLRDDFSGSDLRQLNPELTPELKRTLSEIMGAHTTAEKAVARGPGAAT